MTLPKTRQGGKNKGHQACCVEQKIMRKEPKQIWVGVQEAFRLAETIVGWERKWGGVFHGDSLNCASKTPVLWEGKKTSAAKSSQTSTALYIHNGVKWHCKN